ncbi:hypothetical protein RhiirA5_353401 [Rhizophagus irregularis]|uniref:Uncharacterized protein n=1 Tax=Rhizophagus irregularis TaxID=588596 RepID=A0A2I1EYT4_9GLOM|nr:hypothetical protein RhiirA5_353401 [Rhizophagus irregularis]PKC67203.1 hypothetical protein RhiirA1_418406 [Rhizophagus irregularis]PKY27291.1 hypothetical protein RhiirB3_415940 [Rhizophagus irregularis]
MGVYQIIEELKKSTNTIRTKRMGQLEEIFRRVDGDENTHNSYLNKTIQVIIRLL